MDNQSTTCRPRVYLSRPGRRLFPDTTRILQVSLLAQTRRRHPTRNTLILGVDVNLVFKWTKFYFRVKLWITELLLQSSTD